VQKGVGETLKRVAGFPNRFPTFFCTRQIRKCPNNFFRADCPAEDVFDITDSRSCPQKNIGSPDHGVVLA